MSTRIFLFFSLISYLAFPQKVVVKSDTTNIRIGEQFMYQININDTANVILPEKIENLKINVENLKKEYKKKSDDKKNYNKIFNLIDKLIFLKVPSFKYVYKWRLLQEKKLRVKSKGHKIMSDRQIKNFIMYYERLTKNMLKILPKKANTVINIDKNHRLKSIKFN